ncbi:hypothetical protein OKA04_19355 [Luteolibacter flavescens]|uniref:Uncharacterized protein n=1 Tax=Luteolibacter flavescens TaxID=1859460 RepID=A0ABT3FTJ3_9BACT|nr:hypothetical protein [Luteolibacter flavescens]MCW1886906.1 hypothetical protein [Luteolibacter flavescens]
MLVPLLDESDGSMHESIDGWRRAALWAEIGKRDPQRGKSLLESRFPLDKTTPQLSADPFSEDSAFDDAIASIKSHPASLKHFQEEANLAAFAYFRGRIEACDPSPGTLEPLIADFHGLAEGISNEGWSSQVDELLFRSLAHRNPELAWGILPGAKKESALAQYRSFFTYPAFQGFFDGLDSRKEVIGYAYRWLDHWESPEVKAAYMIEGRVDEQWYHRSYGISGIIVGALERVDAGAVEAWVDASPYYDPDDLVYRASKGPPQPPEDSLIAFPEAHRAIIPEGWSKP